LPEFFLLLRFQSLVRFFLGATWLLFKIWHVGFFGDFFGIPLARFFFSRCSWEPKIKICSGFFRRSFF
jgi:hypothetical protein